MLGTRGTQRQNSDVSVSCEEWVGPFGDFCPHPQSTGTERDAECYLNNLPKVIL